MNVLSEFEHLGVEYKWATEDEVSIVCPFHKDSNPSCNVNVQKRVFNCVACSAQGDFTKLVAKLTGMSRVEVQRSWTERYGSTFDKLIDPATVERYHSQLSAAKPLVKALKDRGVTDDLIRKYRLGENNGRVTIPIRNAEGQFVNIRGYLPGAPTEEKMVSLKGRGEMRWYPVDQLKYEKIVLCGGEIKAIVAADQVNKHDIGATTLTAGEANFTVSRLQALRNKEVYVCYDIDAAGVKAAYQIATQLFPIAKSVYLIDLPLPRDKFPKGDINDFVATGGDVAALIPLAREFEPVVDRKYDDDVEPESVSLHAAMTGDFVDKRIKLTADITALDNNPMVIPKAFVPRCSKDQDFCSACAVYTSQEDLRCSVPDESPVVLDLLNASLSQQSAIMKKAARIPPQCQVVDFEVDEYYTIEDCRVSPALDIMSTEQKRTMQAAYCVGGSIELNETYELVGRMHPDPQTNTSTLLISKYKTATDALSDFSLSNKEALRIFQPDEWTVESLDTKLTSIYDDLSANVTRINDRRDLHLAVDLVYHSCLVFEFEGRVEKGWAEVLVLGDSSQGKSAVSVSLNAFYGLGTKVDCKNATVAGLLGGLQQLGKKWFVTWGVIPTYDRRLVVLEELKGAPVSVISKLTDMRSSGIAELDKIEKRRTHARTRLVAISNPRSDRPMSTYSFGIEAVLELIGFPEDVRRFDLVYIVSEKDVSPHAVNQRNHAEHIHTKELCRDLVLWAWTAEKIVFEDEQLVKSASQRLVEGFTERIPIVDKGSMRLKVARLAAALAARTFSEQDGAIYVRNCHVEYILAFLQRIYSADTFGYADFTKAIEADEELRDPEIVVKAIRNTSFPEDVVDGLLYQNVFDIQDIQDMCSFDRADAQQFISVLVRKRAVKRTARKYFKTPPFIELLKSLQGDKSLKRPEHLTEERRF